ncbi:hypothetical protein [Mycobacterium sp. RTGN5]|uniref:hypothetical protein n=1 Tax=Mycobacterium sp. RTGN5 TaxID=3016522 RepID=UPI0029C6F5C3|nr:hypothetical protein [Mycobacterium sp. RTGN5]
MVPDSSDDLDLAFQLLLNRALTCGQPPGDGSTVGRATSAAISMVARHHPDATAEHIIAAYDAHTVEQRQGAHGSDPAEHLGDNRSVQAIDYAATDALITQLTITYPGVTRDTIAAIVEELRITLADPRLRGIALWRLEHEAHQRLA